jgi:predicted RNase H-like HicB family nuclease
VAVETNDRLASALCAHDQSWTGNGRREAERYLEAEDASDHPEAGWPVMTRRGGRAMRGYIVVFEGDDETGFSAYSPDLPGVVAAGGNRSDTEQLMLEAMAEHIAVLRQQGQPVPEPADADSVTLLDPAAA